MSFHTSSMVLAFGVWWWRLEGETVEEDEDVEEAFEVDGESTLLRSFALLLFLLYLLVSSPSVDGNIWV